MPSGDSDNVYSIGVSNKFDMIDSDMFDDPSELIRAAQEKPKKDKEPKVKGKKDVKPAKTTEKKTMKTESTTDNDNSESEYCYLHQSCGIVCLKSIARLCIPIFDGGDV